MKKYALATICGVVLVQGCGVEAGDDESLESSEVNALPACTPGTRTIAAPLQIRGVQSWNECTIQMQAGVTVPKGAHLRLRPGTVVTVGSPDGSLVQFTVTGRLSAVGTAAQPIRLKGAGLADWETLQRRGGLNRPERLANFGGIETSGTVTLGDVLLTGAHRGVLAVGQAARVDIADSVIEGFPPRMSASRFTGLESRKANVTVRRSLIRGFQVGALAVDAEALSVTDSVVRDNVKGVVVESPYVAASRCGDEPTQPPVEPRPQRVDPVFLRTDVAFNQQEGVVVADGTGIVQFSESQLVGNRFEGLAYSAAQTNAQITFHRNNIFGNGIWAEVDNGARVYPARGLQVQIWSRNVDLRSNYFGTKEPSYSSSFLAPGAVFAHARGYSCFGNADLSNFASQRIATLGPRFANLRPEVRAQALEKSGRFESSVDSVIGDVLPTSATQSVAVPESGPGGNVEVSLELATERYQAVKVFVTSPAGRSATVDIVSGDWGPGNDGSVVLKRTVALRTLPGGDALAGGDRNGEWRIALVGNGPDNYGMPMPRVWMNRAALTFR